MRGGRATAPWRRGPAGETEPVLRPPVDTPTYKRYTLGRVYEKLQVWTRTEAVAKFLRR